MKNPTAVGARELKTRLGTYLRRVRAGQRIVVTERGAPVAELRPLETSGDVQMARLHAAGLVAAPTRAALEPLRAVAVRGRVPTLSQAVVEEREDRF